MAKDTHLINIYLKIHNKQNLTMDDLRYLARYAPECFEKTCKNVVYNFPESKPVMEPAANSNSNFAATPSATSFSQQVSGEMLAIGTQQVSELSLTANTPQSEQTPPTEQQHIEQILENLKLLETNDFPLANVEANEVKTLLGNLYMELLFPHNDKDTFFNAPSYDVTPTFDCKA